MCGIVGVYDLYGKAGELAIKAAKGIQHRGQDGAGLFLKTKEGFNIHKDAGFVHEVFHNVEIPSADMAISHVRYGTQGASEKRKENQRNAGPLEIRIHNELRGAIGHNGDFVGAMPLLEQYNGRRRTDVDTELFILRFEDSQEKNLTNRIRDALQPIAKGAYSIVGIFDDVLFAFRDPLGVWPLVYGRTEKGTHIIASESQMLKGCQYFRDIEPGMILLIDSTGERKYEQLFESTRKAHCTFDNNYFSSPASRTNGISKEILRQRLGNIVACYIDKKPDIVVPVPDSGNSFGFSIAYHLGVRPVPGLLRDHYIGRNFIVEGDHQRLTMEKLQLNDGVDFKGLHVLFADDSTVRGDTAKEIARQAYAAGASIVDFAFSFPLWSHPCNMGINTRTHAELLGHRAGGSLEKAAELTGIRKIFVPTKLDVIRTNMGVAAMSGTSYNESDFCMACVDGEYPIHSPLLHAPLQEQKIYAETKSG